MVEEEDLVRLGMDDLHSDGVEGVVQVRPGREVAEECSPDCWLQEILPPTESVVVDPVVLGRHLAVVSSLGGHHTENMALSPLGP